MVWNWNLHQKCPFKRILPEVKFSLRFLSSPSPRKREITHPPRQSFYYKKIWRYYLLDFKIPFCLSDPLDGHNQASGYSICYNGSGFLNLMANSSGQKTNLKCPCSSFPMPILTKLVPSRLCKYCDFTKIVKFFIKSLEVPKKKQAWILKKMYKLLPLSSPEKEWAEYCFFELNLRHKFSRNF